MSTAQQVKDSINIVNVQLALEAKWQRGTIKVDPAVLKVLVDELKRLSKDE